MSNKYTIENFQKLAQEKGGECLSSQYLGAREHLSFKCSRGHVWEAQASSVIKGGTWCKKCASIDKNYKTKLSLQTMQEYALFKGGKCLSENYANNHTSLKWECAKGHIWNSRWTNVGSGKWCPVCSNNRRLSIDEVKSFAIEKGGKCLSESYTNCGTLLSWRCSEGHTWKANYSSIKHQETWCPVCSQNLGERICRAFFEQLFKTDFPSVFVEWLRTEKGRKMQLDGYSEKLRLAFEHQGQQHYDKHHYNLTGNASLMTIKKRDVYKRQECAKNGVLLIQVPCVLTMLGTEKVKGFIKTELLNNNRSLPEGFDDIEVDLSDTSNSKYYKELEQVAESKGGRLLFGIYKGANKRYKFQCRKGHVWEAKAMSVKNLGTWCPHCAGSVGPGISRLRELAKSKGGVLLSRKIKNSKAKLRWRCEKGHTWETQYIVIQRGGWCPECWHARRRKKKEPPSG